MRQSLNGKSLSLTQFKEIVFNNVKLSLSPTATKQMQKSKKLLDQWIQEDKTIYGLNTGFGIMSDVRISNGDIEKLQHNLIRSHACGVGEPFSRSETRAILLLKAHALALGYSGVRPLVVEKLIGLLNSQTLPHIPQKGSVGASGDLAPLAHLALALMEKGKLTLQGREGLALVNGTQVMCALSALNVIKARTIFSLFDIASALSLEGSLGSRMPFYSKLHALRPHPGQKMIAKKLWDFTSHSQIQDSHKDCPRVQDPYSFRCIPQVHGIALDTLNTVQKIVETEINSVTDNPIILLKEKKFVSGGNFHGQYLSSAMDFLAIAITTLVNISERRIEKLMDPKFSGLPAFLSPHEGLESGLMLAHVTASALASQNKVLSHPASIDTIPTSGNKEDHVSMGVHAALKAKEILENAENVLAIEFLAARQALELRRPLRISPYLEKVMKLLEAHVPPITNDRVFSKDIEKIKILFPTIFMQT